MPKKEIKVILPRGRVLIVAGSDSGGGAGIQADIKTVTALGGYAATAVTALTAQNTMGVQGIYDVPVEFIRRQMEAVVEDIGVDAFKLGMLHTAEIVEAVGQLIGELRVSVPVVLDPVMVAKGGESLLEEEAIQSLRQYMLPRAWLVTPNLPEAEVLSGLKIDTVDDMKKAAEALCGLGAKAALVKGGHLNSDVLHDVLYDGREMHVFESARLATRHTHGTGCTLSSAVATGLAKGWPLLDAVCVARRYVFEAIRTAPGFGMGHGPLNHGHTVCWIS